MSDTLPQNFLAAIGAVATSWGRLEEELKLHASALGSQKFDGWPEDNLELRFKDLRRFWYKEAVANLPEHARDFESINNDLANIVRERSFVIHGAWSRTKTKGKYRVSMIQQKGNTAPSQSEKLNLVEGFFAPRDIWHLSVRIDDLYTRLRAISHPGHS